MPSQVRSPGSRRYHRDSFCARRGDEPGGYSPGSPKALPLGPTGGEDSPRAAQQRHGERSAQRLGPHWPRPGARGRAGVECEGSANIAAAPSSSAVSARPGLTCPAGAT